VRDEVARRRQRSREQIGHTSRSRRVAGNALVIAGTRIPVSAIFDFSAAGYSVEEILREYPTLTEEDIQAVLGQQKAG